MKRSISQIMFATTILSVMLISGCGPEENSIVSAPTQEILQQIQRNEDAMSDSMQEAYGDE